MNKLLIKILFFFLLTGCGERTFTANEFVEYIKNESNNYKLVTVADPLVYTVQYKPVEYVVLSEAENESLTTELFKTRMEELKGYYYFDFVLSPEKKPDNLLNVFKLKDQELIHYLSYDIKHDFSLINEADTLSPELCHYERSVSGVYRFSLLYERPLENSEFTFVFDDLLTGYGPVKFQFKNNILNNAVQLNLKRVNL